MLLIEQVILLSSFSASTLILVRTNPRCCGIVTELFPEMDIFSGESGVPPEEDDDELLVEEPPEEDEDDELLVEELPEDEDELLVKELPEDELELLVEELPEEDELELGEELLFTSFVHVELHPSPLLVFPSSHSSLFCLVPFPHTAQSAKPKQVFELVGQQPFTQQSPPHCVYVQLSHGSVH